MKTLTNMNDEQLVQIFKSGDSRAFEVLLTRYKSRVYAYIFQIVRSRELAEDIFQETFYKAIVTIQQDRYSDSGKFVSWINRIAHNLIIDHFRREKNESTVSSDDFGYEILNSRSLSELSIDDVKSNEQVLRDVANLIKYLPENQQEVVRMRYFEDMSFKEIAEKTNVSINTSLGRMRYALMNMRKIVEEYDLTLELK